MPPFLDQKQNLVIPKHKFEKETYTETWELLFNICIICVIYSLRLRSSYL